MVERKSTRLATVVIVVVASHLIRTPVALGSEAHQAAAAIYQDAGWKRGVCLSLDVAGAELAVALARHSELSVYRLERDADAVRRTRELAKNAGLSPLRIRVEQGTLEDSAYPKWCANLIIADASSGELLRIMRPCGGVAYLRSDAGIPAEGYESRRLSSGLVRLERLALKGAGEWTHYQNDATNNRYSSDQLIRAPFDVLWYGEPVTHRGGFWFVQGLAANGLLYLTDLSPTNPKRCWLAARDAYNGIVHWEREVGADRFVWRPPLSTESSRGFTTQINSPGKIHPGQIAIAEGKIYVGDGRRCLVIDAANGKDVTSLAAPAPSAPENLWSHLAHDDGLLYGYTVAPHDFPAGRRQGAPARRGEIGSPPTLFALDPNSGKPKWVRGGKDDDEFGSALQSPLAMGAGRVFVRAKNTLFALDARTGRTVWSDDKITGERETWWEGTVHDNKLYLLRYDRRFYARRLGAATLIFNAVDGRRLGEESVLDSKTKNKRGPASITSGVIYSASGANGCSLETAAGNVAFGRNGYRVYDQQRNSWGVGDYHGARASCRVGAVPAGGVVHLLPNWGCTCRPFNATMTLIPDRTIEDSAAAPIPKPEVHGVLPADLQTRAQADDWPTFRMHASRDAITHQDISRPMKKAWETTVSGQLTSPIAVGDLVFFGSSDERVRALDAATGKLRWQFYARGSVHASPVYWHGRIYFGSADGWIYCVSAREGKLLWRLQAATHARRQGAFGRIVSAWPVHQGLAVADGKVYFTAGKVSGQGIYSGALDAVSGRVLWRNFDVRGVPSWHVVLAPDRVFVPVENRSGYLNQLGRNDGQPLDVKCALGPAAKMSFVTGREEDAEQLNDGFLVHGGGGVDRFGGRSKGNAYGMTAPWQSANRAKGEEFSNQVRAFFPVVGNARVYFGHMGELVAVERSKMSQFLKTRWSPRTSTDKTALLDWQTHDLPCGKPDWVILAKDDTNDATTLLAGGPKGIAAVASATGAVRWSIVAIQTSLTPAVSRGRVYLTTATGKVVCLNVP